jgi:valyl-tRNA synthetase
MAVAPQRLLTTPLRLADGLTVPQLAGLVAADALVRWAERQGVVLEWAPAVLTGDLRGQLVVERDLSRRGLDRAAIGRDEFVELVRSAEHGQREQAAVALDALGVRAALDDGVLDGPAAVLAARTAFVRLYEAGLLERAERVVDQCTRCETVVDPADAEQAEVTLEPVRLSLAAGDALVELDVAEPELLPGAVAIAVPDDHPAAGATVALPLTGREVPVLADAGQQDVRLVIPAHDPDALEIARRAGLIPIPVIAADGVVEAPGPLADLPRFAARSAARELLLSDGGAQPLEECTGPARRCRQCRTLLLPILGHHWFLPMADLEAAAADVVRERVVFAPQQARDEFLARAGQGGPWCLSRQVWAGQPVPVAMCGDCGRPDIAVEPGGSCGRCMGALVPDDSVLDARFVAALWPLAAAGWPEAEGDAGRDAAATTLLVGPSGIGRWALPMAALGLRLAGAVPFGAIAVQITEGGEAVDVLALVEAEGRHVARVALLAGGLDVEPARALVDAVAAPPKGRADVAAMVEAGQQAFTSGVPATVLAVLAAALREGVPSGDADRVQALAAPLLGR